MPLQDIPLFAEPWVRQRPFYNYFQPPLHPLITALTVFLLDFPKTCLSTLEEPPIDLLCLLKRFHLRVFEQDLVRHRSKKNRGRRDGVRLL